MQRCDLTAGPHPADRPSAHRRRLSTALLGLSSLSAAACLLGLSGLMVLPVPAAAQEGRPAGHRAFPATALRAEFVITAWPEALLDGQPVRLAPGARIRGEDNLLKVPASLAGQALPVHYTREAVSGLVLEVWVLNAVERANRPWPSSEAEARAWAFDPVSQKWGRR